MASITSNLKESLAYPFNDLKKFGVIFILNMIIFSLIIASNYIFVNFLRELIAHNNISNINLVLNNQVSIEVAILQIIAFIISIFILGYIYEVIGNSIEKNNQLPKFNIKKLFINGIKVEIINIIYMIIPLALIQIAISYDLTIILVIGIILAIILALIEIMAIDNMVANKTIKAAFDFKGIIEKIKSIGYLTYVGGIIFYEFSYFIIFCSLFIIMILILPIIILLSIYGVLIIYTILFSAVYSYVLISQAHLYGALYNLAE